MKNEIQIFRNAELGEVRTIDKNGEIWFVAKDVSHILGYGETNNMTRRLDKEEFMSDKLSGMRMKSILLNESGLYSAIIGSKKAEAKKFKKWVTAEVLPTIRKHGGFVANTAMFVDSYFPEMEPGTRATMIELLDTKKVLIKENQRLLSIKSGLETDNNFLVEKNMILEPKGEFFDAVTDSRDAIEMSRAAKVLNFTGMGRTNLFKFLRKIDILRYNNEPYQTHIDNGNLRTIEGKYKTPNGDTHISIKTLVNQKGLNYIRKQLIKAGYKKNDKVF